MEDAQSRCAIFCTSDIPSSTLERLLELTEEHQLGDSSLFSNEPMNTADYLVLMTSKDVSSIHHGLSPPVQPFRSPFIGMSVDEVTTWFKANIAKPEVVGYMSTAFIVLEREAVEDDICTIVCTVDGEEGKLRSDFTLALQNVCVVDTDLSMDEGSMGSFKRSGVAMTKDNYELASSGGMYLDGMEVKIDEAWRDFSKK